jgi:hypothetical protein
MIVVSSNAQANAATGTQHEPSQSRHQKILREQEDPMTSWVTYAIGLSSNEGVAVPTTLW